MFFVGIANLSCGSHIPLSGKSLVFGFGREWLHEGTMSAGRSEKNLGLHLAYNPHLTGICDLIALS